jgi:hypothetical protein
MVALQLNLSTYEEGHIKLSLYVGKCRFKLDFDPIVYSLTQFQNTRLGMQQYVG